MRIQNIWAHLFGAVQCSGEQVAILDDRGQLVALFGSSMDPINHERAQACLAALSHQQKKEELCTTSKR